MPRASNVTPSDLKRTAPKYRIEEQKDVCSPFSWSIAADILPDERRGLVVVHESRGVCRRMVLAALLAMKGDKQ